jgi:rhodanese-related sulfurtransferase
MFKNRKIMKSWAPVFLFVFVFSFFAWTASAQNFDSSFFKNEIELAEYIVMPEILVYKLRAGETDFVIYDVRSKAEYESKHVTDSVNLPWEEMVFQDKLESFPKDKDIYIISGDGTLSFEAVRFLLENGFSRMFCVEGGMENWLYKDLLL